MNAGKLTAATKSVQEPYKIESVISVVMLDSILNSSTTNKGIRRRLTMMDRLVMHSKILDLMIGNTNGRLMMITFCLLNCNPLNQTCSLK